MHDQTAFQPAIGDRIRERRLALGISQARLAEPDYSDSYISLIESGKREPSSKVIETLAQKLGCSATYLLHGLDEQAAAKLKTTLQYGRNLLSGSQAAEALSVFNELLDIPNVRTFPDLYLDARMGKARALEACDQIQDAVTELESIAAAAHDLDWDGWANAHTALRSLTAAGADFTNAAIRLGTALVDAYLDDGDVLLARQLSARLVRDAEAAGSPHARIEAYHRAARVAEALGDSQRGMAFAERALAALTEDCDIRTLGRLRVAYASLLLKAQPDQAGRAHALLAQHTHATDPIAVDDVACRIELARADIALGSPDGAAAMARQVIDKLGDTPSRLAAEALAVLGEAYTELGRYDDAVTAHTRRAEYLDEVGLSRPAAQAWYTVAELLRETGSDAQRQVISYRRALTSIGLSGAGN